MRISIGEAWTAILDSSISRIREDAIDHRLPLSSLLIEVTERCNSRCVLCRTWAKKNPKELMIEDLNGLESSIAYSRIKRIYLTGGEPLLHRNLPELTHYLIRNTQNLKLVSFPTNGLMPRRLDDYLHNLVNMTDIRTQIRVGVSIDGIGEDYEQLRGIAEGYIKALESLRLIKEISRGNRRVSASVLMLISPLNIDNARRTYEYLKSQSCDITLTIATIAPFFSNTDMDGNKTGYSQSQVKELINLLNQASHDYPLHRYLYNSYKQQIIDRKRRLKCTFGRRTLYIAADGGVYLCHYMPDQNPIGFLATDTLDSILTGYEFKAMRSAIDRNPYCSECTSNCDTTTLLQEDGSDFIQYLIRHPMNLIEIITRGMK